MDQRLNFFGFIKERLNNRVNGWTFICFSKGRREVIIKSVVTAFPNHVMSCFRLPKAVMMKLTNAVVPFWWSSRGNVKAMHWKSWQKLCQHKKNFGG